LAVDPLLQIEDLTLHYGSARILHGISMIAQAGEVTCIMGTNGVGKTSLIKAIAGTHPRSGGRLLLGGQALPPLPAHAMAARGVAVVPQGRMIFPLLTVRENLETAFALLPRKDHRIPDEIYDLFPVLRDMGHRRGGDLSGGQQQQLAIARAMLLRPRLLLLDEPTEGIQPNIIQQIGRVIEHLRGKGDMAIVLVEQYFDFAHALADRFYVLRRGTVALEGTKTTLSRDTLRATVSV
jgi:urea transport system ATP-binding protein